MGSRREFPDLLPFQLSANVCFCQCSVLISCRVAHKCTHNMTSVNVCKNTYVSFRNSSVHTQSFSSAVVHHSLPPPSPPHTLRFIFLASCHDIVSCFYQSGLSVIKTPLCSEDKNRVTHCPTCSAEGRALGEGLPCAHHGQSFLICRQASVSHL